MECATPGRILLDIKRLGKYKARGVKQGFRENKLVADGPDFNYYSHVVKFDTVRAALFRRRKLSRVRGIKDVSTAFLQSHSYVEGKYKYICFKHPVTGVWKYYRQSGPIYGEASAPVRWELTLAPWIMEQGFERGENHPSVFYHPGRDLLVLTFVDDCYADGEPDDVDWFFKLLEERFHCKEEEYVLSDAPQDYLGMVIMEDKEGTYLSMEPYIEGALKILNIDQGKRASSTPITMPIENDSPELDKFQVKEFLTALGMLGWLANTSRVDVAYAYSRIAQHAAKPTQAAMKAVLKVFSYLAGTKDLCLQGRTFTPDIDTNSIIGNNMDIEDVWEFYTDSDHAGNAEDQNRRRSQNGMACLLNGGIFKWTSKASSVTFATPLIGEAHADMSSGAAEIYAAGNATLEILGQSYVIEEMGIPFPYPFTLQMDNSAAKIFCEGTAQKTKLKHIDCRQEWVQTLRDKSIMVPAYVPSEENVADILTKILGPQDLVFTTLRDMFMTPKTTKTTKTGPCPM